MSRSEHSNEQLGIMSSEDGLHLSNSILSFDSLGAGQISFLSVAHDSTRNILPQIIATEETTKILEIFRKKPNALVCQYNRPFSIGRLKLELLPSGHALGGASLYLETDSSSTLYAPFIQIQKSKLHRRYQLKKAKTLILGAYNPDPLTTPLNRVKENESLVDKVEAYSKAGQWPIIYCQSFPIAQELSQALSQRSIPVAVQSVIYKINKLYEYYSSSLGGYSQYSPKRSKNKVIILSLSSNRNKKIVSSSDRPEIIVRDNEDSLSLNFSYNQISDDFRFYSQSYGTDFSEIINQVKPKEVCFFGPYSKQYKQAFEKIFPLNFRDLFPNDQPSLF